jgi:hypothetical protein
VVLAVVLVILLLGVALELWAWLRRNPRPLPPPADEVDTDETRFDPDPDDTCRLGGCLDHEHCFNGGTCEQVGATLNVTPITAPIRGRLHYRFPQLPPRKDR